MVYIVCIVLCLSTFYVHVSGNHIVFQKYCLNGTNPKLLPAKGDKSSGTIIMNEKTEVNNLWYQPDMNCTVTLSTENDFSILLTFSNVSLRNSSLDNLTVIFNNENSDAVLAGQQVCSNENCQGLIFESGNFNNLTMKFISANLSVPLNVTGFKAHYTVFDFADEKTGACRGKERFLCENKHCIWYSLTCDGHNDCGDLSDETKCIIPTKNIVWGIVVIFIAIVSVMIFVPLFIFLAHYGTRSIVKTVTLPNQATPLLNAADAGEASGLLTSSEAFSSNWPGTSYERSYSVSYGAAVEAVPSKSLDSKRHSSVTTT